MRWTIVLVIVGGAAIAGCVAGDGTLRVLVGADDADLADFSSLTIVVDSVRVRPSEANPVDLVPQTAQVNLKTARLGAAVAESALAPDSYDRVQLILSMAEGTLTNGTDARVRVPNDVILLASETFRITPAKTIEFRFFIDVVAEGGGSYRLVADQANSGVVADASRSPY